MAVGDRRSRRRFVGQGSERLLLGLAGFIVVIVLWETLVQTGMIRRALLSSPSAIVGAALQEFSTGTLPGHIQTSAVEFVLGFGAAMLTGVPLGLLLGINRYVAAALDPWLSAVYATPTIALLPIIVIIFGIGLESKVIVVWLEAFVVVTVSTMTGVASVERRYIDIVLSFDASRWLAFKSLILPSAFPFILTGARLGVGRALVGVVVAELLAANAGIGYYIALSGATLDTAGVMLGIVLLGVFGIASGEVLRRIEARYERWRPFVR